MPFTASGDFGRYRILKLLGRGGMGSVYLAHDSALGRDVAIKIPDLSGPDAVDLKERFSREARAAATLHHPNICPVYDVGEFDGQPYLTMRYVEGRPLTKFIHPERPQNPRTVAVVIRKLAVGLAEAHRHGIVHRDLKPANIMMDGRNEPIVMDFGLARQMGGANDKKVTQSGMIVGTPAYMSPEQITGDPAQIDARTDIWSLGVILFEMLTGQLPYDGNVLQIIGAIQHVEPPVVLERRTGLPERLNQICRKMMTRDRTERYQDMTEVANDLAAWIKAAGAGSVVADEGAGNDGVLRTTAGDRPGTDLPTKTPWSLAESQAIATPDSATPHSEVGREAVARSSNVVLPRKGGTEKSPRRPSWIAPSMAVAGLILVAGMIYVVSGSGPRKAKDNIVAARADSGSQSTTNGSEVRGWHGWPTDAPKPAIAPFDAAQAEKHQEKWAAYLKQPVEYTNSIGMRFVLIPPGEFSMGRPESEPELFSHEKIGSTDIPAHRVTMTQAYYLGATEVTQDQWQQVKKTAPWSGKPRTVIDDQVPASYINRNAAIDFCRTLSTLEHRTYRLPTEAEWEYACRAGTTSAYWFGDDLKELKNYAWERRNAADRPHPVALKPPNPWGLYDLHGNIAEWCADRYGSYSGEAAIDPQGPSAGDRWVTRGGAFWHLFHVGYRSAYRAGIPDLGNSEQGLRVALSIDVAMSAMDGGTSRVTKDGPASDED